MNIIQIVITIIGIILSACAGIIGAVYYLGNKFGNFETGINNLINRLNNLQCTQSDGHCNLVNTIDNKIDDVNIGLSFVRGELSILKENINSYTIKDRPRIIVSNSPLSLNEIGIDLSKELKASEIIEKNWNKIRNDLDNHVKESNPYDIQEYCMYNAAVNLEKFIGNDDVDFLKSFAFERGNSLMYYTGIFGILIRDKYLSLKGINVSDVDKHDPKLL